MLAKDDYPPHELADIGVTNGPSQIRPGLTTAWNENFLICHICTGDHERQVSCTTCAGRGVLNEIPYCEEPWSEVVPNLWVGGLTTSGLKGHADLDCDEGGFDLVVSLAYPEKHNGPSIADHVVIESMVDGPFSGTNVADVEAASEGILRRLAQGDKILVRCLAGINRSSLLAALVMVKMGMTADEAIDKIRAERSEYCLFNQTYVEHLRRRSAEIHGEEVTGDGVAEARPR